MPRVKRSVTRARSGARFSGRPRATGASRSSNYKYAKEQVEHSLAYAYRDRKVRKREFRRLWIMRINAGARRTASRTTSSSPA